MKLRPVSSMKPRQRRRGQSVTVQHGTAPPERRTSWSRVVRAWRSPSRPRAVMVTPRTVTSSTNASSATPAGAPGTSAVRTFTFATAAASATPPDAATRRGSGISSSSGDAEAVRAPRPAASKKHLQFIKRLPFISIPFPCRRIIPYVMPFARRPRSDSPRPLP